MMPVRGAFTEKSTCSAFFCPPIVNLPFPLARFRNERILHCQCFTMAKNTGYKSHSNDVFRRVCIITVCLEVWLPNSVR